MGGSWVSGEVPKGIPEESGYLPTRTSLFCHRSTSFLEVQQRGHGVNVSIKRGGGGGVEGSETDF